MKLSAIVLTFFARHSAHALPFYADRIPNGYSVPNPGPQGSTWAGVGHENAAGGGTNNQFGLDFAAQGHEWTTDLCLMDSDGDGRSNGLELGDPDCIWFEGGPEPPQGPAISHPGIVDEAKTQDEVADSCAGYESPDDEITLDFVFTTPSLMNEERTHYICEQTTMDVSQLDAAYHKIKSTVLLDNSDVLHHMFIYVCYDGATSVPDGDRVGQGPYACSGLESSCTRVATWAVGPHETCLPENVGALMDFTGMDTLTFKIEAHYDNPTGLAQQDQSGIRIHVTPTLRPLESSSIRLGMAIMDNNFLIPPAQESYPLTNLCPTTLLEYLEHPVYVYSFYPHMHLYGRTLVTEHYRCGKKIGEIGRIDSYEFDNQQPYTLPSPIKILPGDALVTTCTYNSLGSNATIYGGDETTDEMCLNGLGVYPDPRTEEKPSLLSLCMSFENGLRSRPGIPIRAAVGDNVGGTISRSFESDPVANIGACCSATEEKACDDMWLADVGMACGLDADCVGDLVCNAGLCDDPTHLADFPQETEGENGKDAKEDSGLGGESAAAGATSLSLAALVSTMAMIAVF